jgi:prolycopene isomerase
MCFIASSQFARPKADKPLRNPPPPPTHTRTQQTNKHNRPQVGTPRTHRRYLSREDGTYGPIPSRRPLGMLSMPFNTTAIEGLYCVGDSTFPGQVGPGWRGHMGEGKGHRDRAGSLLVLSCQNQPTNQNHPKPQPNPTPQGVNAVVFSGFGCAHRVAVDIGMEPGWPAVDAAYKGLLNYVRDRS